MTKISQALAASLLPIHPSTWPKLLQEKVEMPVLKKKKTPARPKKETFLRNDDSASSTAPSEGGVCLCCSSITSQSD